MRSVIGRILSIVCLTSLGIAKVFAAVNDVLPGDYFPLATGTSTFALYAYDRKSSGPYADQHKLLDGTLDTQIVALRAGHFFEVAGRPLSVVVVLPWANAEMEPVALANLFGKRASGLGDLRVGATGWLVTDRDAGRFVGVTAMMSLPTGDYDRRQALNIGENRSKMTLGLGWIEPLSRTLVFELSPELAWYGDNTDFVGGNRLEQKSTFALTSYLRYRASNNWQFHLGGQLNYGGETRINGADQHNPSDNPRVTLGTTYQTDDRQHQWIARIARDTNIEHGFKTDSELLVRYLRMF